MLYLNQETWLGAAGSKLADQVPLRSDGLCCTFWPAQPLLPLLRTPLHPNTPRCIPLQVRAARAAGIVVVLVHECDPTRGGCEFGAFFSTTPQELIDDGLYARVAIALHSGQHRTVSLCLLAREVGAVRYRMKEALREKSGAVVDAAMRKVAERREPAPKKPSLKAATMALRLSLSSTNTTGPLVSSSSIRRSPGVALIGMIATADNDNNLDDLEEVDTVHIEERPLQCSLEDMPVCIMRV